MADVRIVVAIVGMRIGGHLRVLETRGGAVSPRGEAVIGHIVESVAPGVGARCLEGPGEVVAHGKDHAVILGSGVGLYLFDRPEAGIWLDGGQAIEARRRIGVEAGV